jgi:PEP-CTERM motif
LIGTNETQIEDIAQAQIGPVQSVPEPASIFLLGLALVFALRRRQAMAFACERLVAAAMDTGEASGAPPSIAWMQWTAKSQQLKW